MPREPKKLVSFMLGVEEDLTLDKIANYEDTSKSDLMRKAIKAFIHEYQKGFITVTQIADNHKHVEPGPDFEKVAVTAEEVTLAVQADMERRKNALTEARKKLLQVQESLDASVIRFYDNKGNEYPDPFAN